MSNEKKDIKVTDKRMFTPDGRLREDYLFLDEKSTSTPSTVAAEPEPAAAPPPRPEPQWEPAPQQGFGDDSQFDPRFLGAEQQFLGTEPQRFGAEPEPGPRVDLPTTPPELGGPSFFDVAAVLAEPVPIYLGDLNLPDGEDATNLEMARFYIDLLAVLRQKTAGNLTAQEAAFLEDLLYRLRVRYVQKRG
jgi:Domain of unknown function (DUF1844)